MSGWIVKVETQSMSPGGQPHEAVYLAGTSDPKDAEELVKTFIRHLDESVTATNQVGEEVLKEWSVKPGEVKSLPQWGD